jgi:predicted ATPase
MDLFSLVSDALKHFVSKLMEDPDKGLWRSINKECLAWANEVEHTFQDLPSDNLRRAILAPEWKDAGPARECLARTLENKEVPSEDIWFDAFVERAAEIHASLGSDAVSFFLAPEGERNILLRALAERLHRACAANESLSRVSADSSLRVINDKLDQLGLALPTLVRAADDKVLASNAATRLSLAMIPATSQRLFGRDQELEQLDAAWGGEGTKLVVLVAMGGEGKTALVQTWLGRIRKDQWRGAQSVFGWSFYDQGSAPGGQSSADLFLASALHWFADPEPDVGSPWNKGQRLAAALKKERCLLVLDGLETLQAVPGEDEGRLRDPGLVSLLKELAVENSGLCVITTRLPIDDLKHLLDGPVREIRLYELPAEAGAEILRSAGAKGAEADLRMAAEEYQCHPLSLTLLGSYLREVHDGDVNRRADVSAVTEDEGRHGAHARRVMRSYEAWFRNRAELPLLYILGLFDRQVELSTIEDVCASPPIEGLTEPLAGLGKRQWAQLIGRLRRAKLLGSRKDSAGAILVDAHPMVRQYFSNALQCQQPAAWREANLRLFRHFGKEAKEFPDTVEEMEPLFRAMVFAARAGRKSEALREVYVRRIMRDDQYYAGFRLGALNPLLRVLSQFVHDGDWAKPAPDLSGDEARLVLTHAALFLQATKGYAAAEVVQAFSAARQLGGSVTEAFPILRGIWVYHLVRAQMADASRLAQEAFETAEKIKREELLMEANSALGVTQFYRGGFAAGLSSLQDCAAAYDRNRHRLHSFLYGNDPGVVAMAYEALTLWILGHQTRATARYKEAHALAIHIGHPFSTSLVLHMGCILTQVSGDLAGTRSVAEELINHCSRQGSKHFHAIGKLFRAWALVMSEEGACNEVEQILSAIEEYRSSGAVLGLSHFSCLLGEALGAVGQHERALHVVDEALGLLEERGDSRWKAELHRVRGELLGAKAGSEPGAVLRAFEASKSTAREQGAKSFELRTTIRIARHLLKTGEGEKAHKLLGEIYGLCSEEIEGVDLAEAKTLLGGAG